MTQRKRVIVQGMVQGVGFRYFAQGEAERLGVAGYARNLQNGTVELEIEGAAASVARMLRWLESGPPSAQVVSLYVTDTAPLGETDFRIVH